MLENLTHEQARQKILEMVREYADIFHIEKPYSAGDRIPYAKRVYDWEEMVNLADSALDFWLTAERYAEQFEAALAAFLNIKYCALVNSGSSANLLAFMALTSPLLEEKAIRRGDEVITVAAAFPTTITPMLQYGAVPVFIDVTMEQYNVDTSQLRDALSPKTKAVMLAHTLGNPFDIEKIKAFCDEYGLWLIEDNCDALGSKYTLGDVKKYTGTFGDIGTSSFYPPHHITMGEGGAVYTDNPMLHKILVSMRDWGRDCVCPSGKDNFCGHRFDRQYGELPLGYDHKYIYSHFGYNLKVTDMQAAIGLAQLKKLPSFIERRQRNFNLLSEGLSGLSDRLLLPSPAPNSSPSWFGFMITCREGVDRNKLVHHLESKGIQTRNLFAGNLIKHPCFDDMRRSGEGYRIAGSLKNTDRIMRHTFWIGVYPGLTDEMIGDMVKTIYGVAYKTSSHVYG